MRRHFSGLALLVLALAAATPSPSRGGVPDPGSSTWPHHVLLVGTDASGTVDPAGRMDFTICRIGCVERFPGTIIVFDLSQKRSDFDGDGVLGASDLSKWLEVYFGNGSTRSCSGSTCP